MRHFCGSVEGSGGAVTRQGDKEFGMVTCCASRVGAIRSYAWVNQEGVDMVRVEKVQWKGIGERRLLYEGPIGHPEGLPEQFGESEGKEGPSGKLQIEEQNGNWWVMKPCLGPYSTYTLAKEAYLATPCSNPEK